MIKYYRNIIHSYTFIIYEKNVVNQFLNIICIKIKIKIKFLIKEKVIYIYMYK